MGTNQHDLLFPELSYKVIGAAFAVYNELGWGHREQIYQKAFAETLKKLSITFEREKYVPITYQGAMIGKNFLDFIVENILVVELKVMPKMGYVHINQVISYLKSTNLKLAIIIYFLKDGVRYKRVIRTKSD